MATPPPEFQKTMLMPRRDVGSHLPPGTALQEYVVEGLVGIGGFSIVYRARDTRLDRRVALKEYIPAALATRGAGGQVVARSPAHQAAYDAGLKGFINEARLLASFDHPALVKVYRFWADNGSAYMAMPYYEGITFHRWLKDLGAPPSEPWLRVFAEQTMEALATLHAQRCYHRDVAPDNVLLLHDRHLGTSYLEQRPRPLLLDFGAARRVIGDATQNLTAILKPGYSPVEQYDGDGGMKQGPWTDVYALCGLLYSAIGGKVPPSAIARVVKDDLVPAAERGAGRYSPSFLAAIDAGLSVWPAARPQSVAELRALFDAPLPGMVSVRALAIPTPAPAPVPDAEAGPPPATPRGLRGWWASLRARWFG